MPEFIQCNDGEAFLNGSGNRIICRIDDGAQLLTEAQIIEIYAVSEGPIEMEADFYSFLAYTACFFAFGLGFLAGKTR